MNELMTASALANIGGWTAFVALLIWVFMRHQNGKWWTDGAVQRMLAEKELRLQELLERNDKLEEVIEKKRETDRVRDEIQRELVKHVGDIARQTQTTEKVVHAFAEALGIEESR